uniref:Ig-like domain-containing protein n=1 Tax=Acrobeloides nanus TaxID=290746 RepID=A0A914EJ73_9BILA
MAQKYQPQQQQPPPQQYPYSYNRGPFSRSQPNSDSENAFSPVTIISESETEPELAGLNNRGTGPIIRTELRGLRLTEGTDAILQCNVMGNPKPRIAWLKNGIALNPAGPPRIQMNYKGSLAILKISMVTPDDSGEYTIVADNPYGKV